MRHPLAIFRLAAGLLWLVSAAGGSTRQVPPSDSTTRLLRACEAGDVAEVQRLLEAKVDPNGVDVGKKSALMFAAEYEDTTAASEGRSSEEMVTALLNAGAKVTLVSLQKETAVMKAIAKNNDGAAKLLLNKGARVRVKVVDRQTVEVSPVIAVKRPRPCLRLHVEEAFSQGEWLATEGSGIKGMAAWKRPTNAHYRNMLALLLEAAHSGSR